MASFPRKVLWCEGMNQQGEATLLAHCKAAGATGVCIQNISARLPGAIARFHAAGIKVYAWRWPSTNPKSKALHYYAIEEANFVVNQLLPLGLDGYVADIESEEDGKQNDWNDTKFAPLIRQYCSKIRDGAAKAGLADFLFAMTSGCTYPKSRTDIDWSNLADASDCLLPQTNGKTPAKAIAAAMPVWGKIAKGKPIVPMAGAIDLVSAADIAAYGAIAATAGVSSLHFYADPVMIQPAVLQAIADL